MPEFGIRCGFKIRCWKASGFDPQLGDQPHLFHFSCASITTRSTTPFKNNHHNRYLLPQVWWIKTVYINWWCKREHALRKQVNYRFESCEVNTQRFTRRKNGNEFHTVSIGTDSRSCTIRGAMVSSVCMERMRGEIQSAWVDAVFRAQ